MKSVNIYFEDEDFEILKETKGDLSWRDFFLQLKPIDEREAEET